MNAYTSTRSSAWFATISYMYLRDMQYLEMLWTQVKNMRENDWKVGCLDSRHVHVL